jgi:putative hemolysin
MNGTVLELVFLCVLLMLSAFFSLSETAITSVSNIRIKNLFDRKVRGSKALHKLRENPSRLLGSVLIGNNIVNISASSLITSMIIFHMERVGLANVGYSVGIATGLMTFLILVFGEITPKTIAIKNADRIALVTAPYIDGFATVIQPLINLLTAISSPIIKMFGARVPAKGAFLSREEIQMLLAVSEKEGEIEQEEREMISSIFEFGSTVAREVMTPRPDIIGVEVNEPVQKIISVMVETGHSRIPVYEGTVDNILGVIYAKELLKLVGDGGNTPTLKDFLRPLLFIPESKKVNELLHQMQAARTHVAIIVDEYGTTVGLVTIEDMLEEIVGEIHDEFEKPERDILKIDKNVWEVDAKVSISSLNKRLEVDIPEGEYDTISGFVFSLLGKVPVVGDVVTWQDLSISVERIHKRRITRVKILKLPKKDTEEAVGG